MCQPEPVVTGAARLPVVVRPGPSSPWSASRSRTAQAATPVVDVVATTLQPDSTKLDVVVHDVDDGLMEVQLTKKSVTVLVLHEVTLVGVGWFLGPGLGLGKGLGSSGSAKPPPPQSSRQGAEQNRPRHNLPQKAWQTGPGAPRVIVIVGKAGSRVVLVV